MAWNYVKLAAQAVTSVGAAGAVLIGAGSYLVGPRFTQWAEGLVEQTTAELSAEVDELQSVVDSLASTVDDVRRDQDAMSAPAWQWDPVETIISDGDIGGEVLVRAAGRKLRDCGSPLVDIYFVNGEQRFHRFQNVSILDTDGRGPALPASPEEVITINFTAEIPRREGIFSGRASGFITFSYPDLCPNARAETVGPLAFWIRRPRDVE